MVTVQIHIAGGNQEVAVDQVHNAVRQIGREVGPVIGAAVFAQAPGDVDPRVALAQGQLDIGIGLVIAQQDVKARLFLLDKVVLKRKSLFIVVNDDVVNVGGLSDQGAGFGVLGPAFEKIGAHP